MRAQTEMATVLALPQDELAEKVAAYFQQYFEAQIADDSGRTVLLVEEMIFPEKTDEARAALMQGDAYYAEAKLRVQEFELEKAVVALHRAQVEFEGASVIFDATRKMGSCFYLEGIIEGFLGNERKAMALFKSGYVLAPDLKPDSSLMNPEIRGLYNGAVASAEGQRGGRLQVGTKPSGAQVFINDSFRGISPLTLKGLVPGDYYVRVRHRSGFPKAEKVQVERKGRTFSSISMDTNENAGKGKLSFLSNRLVESALAKLQQGPISPEDEVSTALSTFDTESVFVITATSEQDSVFMGVYLFQHSEDDWWL
ncbi:MAG: PEGA domain-containing protein, partial [Myxococcota bacterium]|nr:PEGA domain-containing protein [Myxococcota bacterium]